MMKKWIRCPAILMTNHNNRKRRIFNPREEFHKYNYVVNLSEMADLAEGGELHVGQFDLHTNPNGTMREYNNVLDSFGGALSTSSTR